MATNKNLKFEKFNKNFYKEIFEKNDIQKKGILSVELLAESLKKNNVAGIAQVKEIKNKIKKGVRKNFKNKKSHVFYKR